MKGDRVDCATGGAAEIVDLPGSAVVHMFNKVWQLEGVWTSSWELAEIRGL
jgi:hypothetical protein